MLSLICTWSFDKNSLHIKDNNNSPRGKFHRFLFPLSSKFPDLNFAPYVLYIYSCHETRTWHKQWIWDTRPRASPAYIKGNENECYAGSQIYESKCCMRLTEHRYRLTSEIMQSCQHGDFWRKMLLLFPVMCPRSNHNEWSNQYQCVLPQKNPRDTTIARLNCRIPGHFEAIPLKQWLRGSLDTWRVMTT